MTHNGNQLTRVVDNSTTTPVQGSEDFKDYTNKAGQYTYNRNGAMDKDTHKGILGIKYNSLNLPTELAVKNINTSGKTYYTYSASGVKLRVVHKDAKNQTYTPVMGTSGDSNLETSKVTDYVGNKVYENEGLKRILVDGGYIENNVYHYYLKDHLGNNRVVINQYNEQIQNSQYYPFGMAMAESTSQSTQPYKYNGKELDKTHGMNLYDYSARYYDGALGRFTTVDPLAEKYYSISPYVYCNNNPIKFIDPDGRMFGWPPFDPSYYRQAAANNQADKVIKENSSTLQKNGTLVVASMSDVNDAVVLGTVITRGSNAINIDGTPASGVDIGFAAVGAVIPVVSGSLLKGIVKSIGKALGIVSDAKKAEKVVDGAQSGARTQPRNLQEQLTLEEAKSGAGVDYSGRLGDPKYKENGGDFVKKQHNHNHGDGTSTEVHYDVNTKTGEASGFKIKDDTNSDSRGHRYPDLKTR